MRRDKEEFVIPGRDEVASPESIVRRTCGQMDSGFSLREPRNDGELLRRLPRRTGELHQRVVSDGFDRREIAMRDVFGPRRGADVV